MQHSRKTGIRLVPFQTDLLKEFVSNNLIADDPSAYLWATKDSRRLKNGSPFRGYTWFYETLADMAQRAGLKNKKFTSAHAFRHAAATLAACNGTNEATMRIIFGWSKDSDTPSIYTHMSSSSALATFRKNVYGETGEESKPKPMGIKCACGKLCELGAGFCSGCGAKLAPTEPIFTKSQLEPVREFQAFERLAEAEKKIDSQLEDIKATLLEEVRAGLIPNLPEKKRRKNLKL